MIYRIRGSTAFENIGLRVEPAQLVFYSGVLTTRTRRFDYREIAAVLLSADGGKLSFQVGQEVFTVPVKKGKREHADAVAALVQRAGAARQESIHGHA